MNILKTLCTAALAIFVIVQPDIAGAVDLDVDEFESVPGIEEMTADIEEESKRSWQGTFGLGAAFVPDYEGSEDYDVVPVPFVRIHWQNDRFVELFALTLKGNIVPSRTWEFGPILRFSPGRDDVDNSAVDAMRDVDDSLELGAFAAYRLQSWSTRVQVLHDVADGHGGLLADFRIGYSRQIFKKTRLTIGVSTTYADDDYMETFFGVNAIDSGLSGLPVYAADGEMKDVGIDIALGRVLRGNWSIITAFKYKRLLGDAEDSPLVEGIGGVGSADQFSGIFIVSYTYN